MTTLPFANLCEIGNSTMYKATCGDGINDVLIVLRIEASRSGKNAILNWNGKLLVVTPRMTLDQLCATRSGVAEIDFAPGDKERILANRDRLCRWIRTGAIS